MNWFDLVIVTVILIALVRGFFSGFVAEVASLAGLLLGAIFAGKLSEIIAPKLIQFTQVSSSIIGPLSYIVAFVLIVVALFFAGKLLESFIDAIQMGMLNKLAGGLFCSLKWIVLLSILLNLIVELDQNKYIIKEDIREQSHTYTLVMDAAQIVIPYLRFDKILE